MTMTSRTTMRLVSAAALTLTLALALTACGHSPPTRYFSLDAVPPSAPLMTANLANLTDMAPVQLGAVRMPATLDRPEIVAQDAAYRLAVRENDHWGAPLAPMIRRTLAQDLLARLPSGAFVVPDAPAPTGTRGIVVTVLDLRANTDGRMTFEGTWTLTAGEAGTPLMTQEVSLTEPMASADSSAIADALSRVIGRLADRIATSLASSRDAGVAKK
jgi:uncharacterized lipoprotein YmbA